MKTHELKSRPELFRCIEKGVQMFDVRKGDGRVYSVGDWLWLREWTPVPMPGVAAGYTGKCVYKRIAHIMHGVEWLPDDVWVLGFTQ